MPASRSVATPTAVCPTNDSDIKKESADAEKMDVDHSPPVSVPANSPSPMPVGEIKGNTSPIRHHQSTGYPQHHPNIPAASIPPPATTAIIASNQQPPESVVAPPNSTTSHHPPQSGHGITSHIHQGIFK